MLAPLTALLPTMFAAVVEASAWSLVLVIDGSIAAISATAADRLGVAARSAWSAAWVGDHADAVIHTIRDTHTCVEQQLIARQTGHRVVITGVPLGDNGAVLVHLTPPDEAERQRRLLDVLTAAAHAIQGAHDVDGLFVALASILKHQGVIMQPGIVQGEEVVFSTKQWRIINDQHIQKIVALIPPELVFTMQNTSLQHVWNERVPLVIAPTAMRATTWGMLGESLSVLLAPHGWLVLPLGEGKGILCVGGPLLRPADLPLVNLFAQQLQAVINHLYVMQARLLEEQRHISLLRVSHAVSNNIDIGEVLRVVCEEAQRLVGGNAGLVFLREADGTTLRCSMAVGRQAEHLLGSRVSMTTSLLGAVMRTDESERVGDVQHDPRATLATSTGLWAGMRAVLLVPLRVEHEVVGVLVVSHTTPDAFAVGQLVLVEHYAPMVGLALERQRHQQRLQGAEQRYRALYEDANDLAFTFALDGRLLEWNAATLRFLGLSPAEMRMHGLSIHDLLPATPDDPNYERERRLLSGTPIRTPLEIDIRRPNGQPAVLEVTSQLLQERGRPVGVAVLARDTTERHQVQRLLTTQLDKLTILHGLSIALSSSLDLPTLLEATGQFLVQATASDCLGLYLADSTGVYQRMLQHKPHAGLPTVLPPELVVASMWEEHDSIMLRIHDLDINPRQTACETLLVLPLHTNQSLHGLLIIGQYPATPPNSDDVRYMQTLAGHIAQAVANVRLYQQIEAVAADYRDLYENANDLIGTVALDGRFLTLNNAMLQFLGYTADEVPSLHLNDLLPSDEQQRMPGLWRDVRNQGPTGTSYEQTVRRRDGTLAALEVRSRLRTTNGQRSIHFIARDLTARQALEAQVRQGEKLAAVGQMVAGVAHEINNPLTVVLGTTQLLKLGDLAPAQLEDLLHIEAATLRARHIVQQLLTFARQHPSRFSSVDVAQLLQTALSAMRGDIARVDVAVQMNVPADLPAVNGDVHQLQQVVINLLQNALQALVERGPPRRITISTAVVNARLCITVSDNGPGIAPQDLPRLFDPFFTTKPPGQGTGLGLSIVYGIVQNHDGQVWVESSVGEGATFVVELPLLGTQRHVMALPTPSVPAVNGASYPITGPTA